MRANAALPTARWILACATLAAVCTSCTAAPAHPAAPKALIAAPGHGLAAPGCTTATASAPGLKTVRTSYLHVGGSPYAVVVTPDGRWAFASLGDSVAVLRTSPTLSLVHTIALAVPPASAQDEVLTSDGRYLLVAADYGAVVINVARAERGAPDAVLGTLSAPVTGQSPTQITNMNSATQAAVTPDGQYAFVTLEYANVAAVFDLGRALAHGFTASDFVGDIPLGTTATGLAVAPGGRWLYAVSQFARPGSLAAGRADRQMGSLSVISVARAETDPAASVLAAVPAGCQPVRVITSANGDEVWVTARESDAVLCFSAAALHSSPSRALVADVPVGEAPVGLVLVRGGTRMVVADSNRFGRRGVTSNLAVLSVQAARATLLGNAPAGQFPRQFALAPGGATLYATDYDSGQLQTVDVATLP
jgi:DNA-binding beta-propeller fold protein YncE